MNCLNFIKLKFLLVVSTVLTVTSGAPVSKDTEATILKYENTNDGTGNYYFRFETSNGITREEKGTLVDAGLESEHISVEGSYSYINEEGKIETVKYVSDENGYTILTSHEVLPPARNRNHGLSPAVVASLLGK